MKTQAERIAEKLNGREVEINNSVLSTMYSWTQRIESSNLIEILEGKDYRDEKMLVEYFQKKSGTNLKLNNENIEKMRRENNIGGIVVGWIAMEVRKMKKLENVFKLGSTLIVNIQPTKTGILTNREGLLQIPAQDIALILNCSLYEILEDGKVFDTVEAMIEEGRDVIMVMGRYILEKFRPGAKVTPFSCKNTNFYSWAELEQKWVYDEFTKLGGVNREYYYETQYDYRWSDERETIEREETEGRTFGVPNEIADELMEIYMKKYH